MPTMSVRPSDFQAGCLHGYQVWYILDHACIHGQHHAAQSSYLQRCVDNMLPATVSVVQADITLDRWWSCQGKLICYPACICCASPCTCTVKGASKTYLAGFVQWRCGRGQSSATAVITDCECGTWNPFYSGVCWSSMLMYAYIHAPEGRWLMAETPAVQLEAW